MRLGSLLRLSALLLEVALLLRLIVLLELRLPLLLEVALLLLRCSLLLEVTLFLRLIMLLLEVALFLGLVVLLEPRLRATHRVGSARAIGLWAVSRSSETSSCGGRMLKGGLRWMSLVLIEELLPVLSSLLVKLPLLRSRRRMPLAHRFGLCQGGPEIDAAAPTVVAHAVVVVHDYSAVVDIMDVDFVDAIDGAVVEEVVAVPVTALIAVAAVSEAVVDAAIEADVRAPVSAMEEIAAAEETPVRRRPECADVGRSNPDTGNPVITGGSVAPVAGGPEIIGCGSRRLLVLRQRRRRLSSLFCGGWSSYLVIVRSRQSSGRGRSAGHWSRLLG